MTKITDNPEITHLARDTLVAIQDAYAAYNKYAVKAIKEGVRPPKGLVEHGKVQVAAVKSVMPDGNINNISTDAKDWKLIANAAAKGFAVFNVEDAPKEWRDLADLWSNVAAKAHKVVEALEKGTIELWSFPGQIQEGALEKANCCLADQDIDAAVVQTHSDKKGYRYHLSVKNRKDEFKAIAALVENDLWPLPTLEDETCLKPKTRRKKRVR